VANRFSQAPSLPARLRKRNLRDALVLATDIASAMVFLHGMDIVHGRLTPGAPRRPALSPAGGGSHVRSQPDRVRHFFKNLCKTDSLWYTPFGVLPMRAGGACLHLHMVPCLQA